MFSPGHRFVFAASSVWTSRCARVPASSSSPETSTARGFVGLRALQSRRACLRPCPSSPRPRVGEKKGRARGRQWAGDPGFLSYQKSEPSPVVALRRPSSSSPPSGNSEGVVLQVSPPRGRALRDRRVTSGSRARVPHPHRHRPRRVDPPGRAVGNCESPSSCLLREELRE